MPIERLELREFCRSDQDLMLKAARREFTHFKIRHEPDGLSLVALLSSSEAGNAPRTSEVIVAACDIVGLVMPRGRRRDRARALAD